MYILILALLGGYNGNSPAITNIPGFTTQEACLTAGTQWSTYIRSTSNVVYPVAYCVKQ